MITAFVFGGHALFVCSRRRDDHDEGLETYERRLVIRQRETIQILERAAALRQASAVQRNYDPRAFENEIIKITLNKDHVVEYAFEQSDNGLSTSSLTHGSCDGLLTSSSDTPSSYYNCVICLKNFHDVHQKDGDVDDVVDDESNDIVMIRRCKHIFHLGCTHQWLKDGKSKEKRCPICRANIPESKIGYCTES